MRALFILLLVSGCGVKKSDLDFAINEQPLPEVTDSVSFEMVKREVFIPKCISCHAGTNGVDLRNYESTFAHLNSIEHSVFQTKSMPRAPVTRLNKRQLEILNAWIEAGAPEIPEKTESPTSGFALIKKEIIDMKCISCHSGSEHAAHIPLGTREDLLNSLLVPGRPLESSFYTITLPGAMNMMPPIGVDPLTEKERKLIHDWISEGAL